MDAWMLGCLDACLFVCLCRREHRFREICWILGQNPGQPVAAWGNEGQNPGQPVATSCIRVDQGQNPGQPVATSCIRVDQGQNPGQPVATSCIRVDPL